MTRREVLADEMQRHVEHLRRDIDRVMEYFDAVILLLEGADLSWLDRQNSPDFLAELRKKLDQIQARKIIPFREAPDLTGPDYNPVDW
jgi:hypothetical protein